MLSRRTGACFVSNSKTFFFVSTKKSNATLSQRVLRYGISVSFFFPGKCNFLDNEEMCSLYSEILNIVISDYNAVYLWNILHSFQKKKFWKFSKNPARNISKDKQNNKLILESRFSFCGLLKVYTFVNRHKHVMSPIRSYFSLI